MSQHTTTRDALLEARRDVERMLSRGEIDRTFAKIRLAIIAGALGEPVKLTITERPDFKKRAAGDREDA